jgi:signal-transduction protein with cAMP-binding, CBS, and nucleotidyltransferase domain
LRELARTVEIEHVAAGETILHQGGEPAKHLYVIRKGGVELLDDGRLLDLLGEGEVFGQFSLLGHEPPPLTVRAHEDTLCYLIPEASADPVLDTSPGRSFRDRVDASQDPVLWDVRLRHRAEQVRAGAPPDDFTDPGRLGPVARQGLKESFRMIERAQRRLAMELGVQFKR